MSKNIFNKSDIDIVISAHRGYRSEYPENTMLAFKKAVELGVDQIETDVRLTKDKKLILIHDDLVDRTTNGTGKVCDFTFDEIEQLDAGAWKDDKFKGEKIPTLKEFLDFVKDLDVTLNIEIKDYTHECVDATIDLINSYGDAFKDRFVIAAWDAEIIEYANEKYGVRTQGFPKTIFRNYTESTHKHMYASGIPVDMITKEMVREYNDLGIIPFCWCNDNEETVMKAVECGARLVTCNDPVPALKILTKLGLRIKK